MKKAWISASLAVVLASATTLGAQQNPPAGQPGQQPTTQPPATQQPRPSTPPAASSQQEKKITVSGCLEKGEQASEFILANATMAGAKPDSPGAAPTGTAGMKTRYTLVGKSDELAKHQGHRIEVTGTLAAASPSSGAPSPSQQPSSSSTQAAQRLRVDSVKMVAADCK
jgi:hypothetical protein